MIYNNNNNNNKTNFDHNETVQTINYFPDPNLSGLQDDI